ncbi:hypothetical protein [Dactylosporangium sp. CA-092794]|uniref:hypothetical protein n=1 Tax=Dactylosporangium sp. CA-092794 TaxID=3239929 RepID=UPI003D8A0FD5
MTDEYYGYTRVQLPGSIAQYDDYTYGTGIVDYQPTDWNAESTTIEMMWPWIQIDSDARATALADMWRRVHTLLDNTGRNLRRYSDALADNWNSDASKVFLREIGAALSSIDEWKEIASTNATGLDVLASTIAWNQKNALRVWREYVSAINNPGSVPGSAPTQAGRKAQPEKEDHRKARLIKKYTEDIKPYVKDLADTYLLVYFNYLSWGTRFKGPTNAAKAQEPTIRPGGPGGHLPPPPILPPPAFPDPDRPDLSKLALSQLGIGEPPLPTGDHALTLAGGAVVPSLPTLPEFPTVTGAGVSAALAGLPPLPGLSGLGRGALPPGVDPGELNSRLSGQPGAGARPPLPGRPNLSGLRPPPNGGARPPVPPGRGNPNLRGARGRGSAVTGPDLSEEMQRPGSPRAPMPPRLAGRRGSGPAGHMAPENERLGGRGLPPGARGSGAPGERLTGRRGPAGLPAEEQEALNRRAQARPALEGRGGLKRPAAPLADDAGRGPTLRGRNATTEPHHQRPAGDRHGDHRAAHDPEVVAGEDELWALDGSNPAVIYRPHTPPPPTDPGPAIGRP